MTFDYETLKTETVEPLIERFGKIAHLLVPWNDAKGYVEEGYWAEGYVGPGHAPWNPPEEYRYEYPVWFVETGYKIESLRGTYIQQGDKLGIVSTKALTVPGPMPKKNRDIRIDGIVYRTIDLQPLNPGGTIMLYTVHARK